MKLAFNVEEKEKDIFIDLSESKRTHLSPLEATKIFIKKISKDYPAPYTIMASGGIDSQATIQSWLNSGVEFNIVSFKFENDLNSHDLETLDKLSAKLGISVEYQNFNIIEFLENNLTDYAKKYNCASPQICSHMSWVDQIKEGTVVMSGSCPFLWGIEFTYDLFPMFNYINQTKKNLIPFFFLHDIDVCNSFLSIQDATLHSTINVKQKVAYQKKIQIYRDSGFDILPQKEKYSGFELVKNIYDTKLHLTSPREKLKWQSMSSKRIFDIIFRYRLHDLINRPNKTITCIPANI